MASIYEKLKQHKSIIPTIDKDKYKLLYEYTKERYIEESQRYKALEDKSLKYLTSISFAIASFVLLLRWSLPDIKEIKDPIDCFILFFILTTLIFFSASWYQVFKSIKLEDIQRMNSSNDMIKFFKGYKINAINLAMSKKYLKAAQENKKVYSRKLRYVKDGYDYIFYSAISFMLFVSVLMIKYIS